MTKVLVTGMTAQQCGRDPQLRYDPVSALWAAALREVYEVEYRPAATDEDVVQFDGVVIALAPPASLNTLHVYTALSTLERCMSEGVPWTISLDDWAFGNLFSSLRTMSRAPWRLTKELFAYKHDWEFGRQNQDRLMVAINQLAHEPIPRVLIPAYTWGDHSIFEDHVHAKEYICLDPSAFARAYELDPIPNEARRHTWVLGALVKNEQWVESLDLSWPVERYGVEKGVKLMEQELVQTYSEAWGVLSVPYVHAGSGWWRNRFVYAAQTRAIALATCDEVAPLGPAFTTPAQHIESLSTAELAALAEEQAALILGQITPRDEVVQRLSEVVVSAL